MKFSEFIGKLYPHYACSSQERFVLQVFSALCGEKDPIGTSGKTGRGDRSGSDCLPEGLRGDDTTRKALYGGAKYVGLTAPIRQHVLVHKNEDTFTAYSEESVSQDEFSKLCSDLGLESKYQRNVVFKAIFEQFLEFAKSTNDDVADVLLQKIEEAQNDIKPVSKFSVSNVGSHIENQKIVNIETVNGNITL